MHSSAAAVGKTFDDKGFSKIKVNAQKPL